MKRFLSLILAVTVLASMLSVGASVFAEKTKAPKQKNFSFSRSSDGNRDSFGRYFVRGKVQSNGNKFAWGRNRGNRSYKFNVPSDGAWRKEFKAGSDGNKFAGGRNRGNCPNKFNVSSDGAWRKEFKAGSDGNKFARGRNKGNRPNKFNVSSDGAWRKEFKVGSDGNKFSQRKARGNKFPAKKQAPGKNMFFSRDKNNMNIFEKGKNFKPYKK